MSVKVRKYKKGRGGWEVDVSGAYPDGTRYRLRKKSPVASKTGSRRWGEALERELLASGPRKSPKEVPTLRDFETRFREGHVRAEQLKESYGDSLRSIFANHLEPVFGGMRLDEIGDEEIQKFKARLADMAPKTGNNILSGLNVRLKRAVEWSVIDKMPCRIRLFRVAEVELDFFDFDTYERLVRAARDLDWRIEVVVRLGGEAGLRLGEKLAIEQTDIDFQTNYLSIQRAEWRGHVGLPKGGQIRRVPMTPPLAAVLRSNRHLRGPRVLYRDDGSTVSKKVIHNWMAKALRRAGLAVGETGRDHVLRHTFCSHLAMRGVPARTIQKLAGHKNLSTTLRYMHLSPSAIEDGIRALGSPGDGHSIWRNIGDGSDHSVEAE